MRAKMTRNIRNHNQFSYFGQTKASGRNQPQAVEENSDVQTNIQKAENDAIPIRFAEDGVKPSFIETRIPLSERPLRKLSSDSPISVNEVVVAGTFSDTLEHLVFGHPTLVPLFRAARVASEKRRYLLCEDAGFLTYCFGHDDRFLPIKNTHEPDSIHETSQDDDWGVPRAIDQYYAAVRQRVCALFSMLRNEHLVAIGHTENGDRVAISHAIWSHPAYFVHPQLNEVYEAKPMRMVRRWLGICFEKGSPGFVIGAERTNIAGANEVRTPTTTMKAYDACVAWLCEEMSQSPHARKGKKSDWMQSALEKWSGALSKRAFLRAWDASISQTKAWSWGHPGAPRRLRETNHRAD
jgi:hypothetical protein